MSGTVEIRDDGIEPNTIGSDPEKTPYPQATDERIGDQITHEMLEELAPNGEGDYILDTINNMTEEEALAILEESVKFHADDWNFVRLNFILICYFIPTRLESLRAVSGASIPACPSVLGTKIAPKLLAPSHYFSNFQC